MNAMTTNLITVVISWTEPMFFAPDKLIAAGIHSPTRAPARLKVGEKFAAGLGPKGPVSLAARP